MTISNDIVQNYQFQGIDVEGASGLNDGIDVKNNLVSNVPGETGVGYGLGIGFEDDSYGTISNNVLQGVRRGVQIDSNHTEPNRKYRDGVGQHNDAGQMGIWDNNNFGTAGAVTIQNNTITSSAASTIVSSNKNYSGIFLSSLWDTIGTVSVTNNTISGKFNYGIQGWNNAKDVTVQGGSIAADAMTAGVHVESLDDPSR